MTVFSADEIVTLDKYQREGQMHPFTCANRGDGKHRDIGGDLGALFPTVRGWVCPFCDYTQNWPSPRSLLCTSGKDTRRD